MTVVGDFFGRVHADTRLEGLDLAVARFGIDGGFFSRSQSGYAFHVEDFVASEAERFAGFAAQKFQRKDAHTDEITAMNALIAFRQNRADSEKARAFGGPVPR